MTWIEAPAPPGNRHSPTLEETAPVVDSTVNFGPIRSVAPIAEVELALDLGVLQNLSCARYPEWLR
jgi:hypothetical protein